MKLFDRIKNWFLPAKEVISKYALERIQEISTLDGKAGLSIADVSALISKIEAIHTLLQSQSGKERAQAVVNWVDNQFGDRIPDGWSNIIVAYAYDAALSIGKIK